MAPLERCSISSYPQTSLHAHDRSCNDVGNAKIVVICTDFQAVLSELYFVRKRHSTSPLTSRRNQVTVPALTLLSFSVAWVSSWILTSCQPQSHFRTACCVKGSSEREMVNWEWMTDLMGNTSQGLLIKSLFV